MHIRTLFLALVATVAIMSVGCYHRYDSTRGSVLGPTVESYRESSPFHSVGADRVAPPGLAMLDACTSRALTSRRVMTDIEMDRVDRLRAGLVGYYPAMMTSSMPNDFVMCLGIASGYDLGTAVDLAQAMGNGGYGSSGSYRRWTLGASRMGAGGVY